MSPRKQRQAVTPAPPPRPRGPGKFGRFAAARGEGVRRYDRLLLKAAAGVAGLTAIVVLFAVTFSFGGRAPQAQPLTLPAATQTGAQATATPRPPVVLTGIGAGRSEGFNLQPGPVKFTMKHEGKAAFTVRLEDSQGLPAGGAAGLGSELTNSVGAFSGEKSTAVSSLGAYRVSVTADGPWQITVQQ